MRKKYNPRVIEPKWQKIWKEKKSFQADTNSSKPKYYVLDMFPYPSGAGLHVGHVVGYTGTDILARYKRQQGFNVLHPIGWDSFGLPAEQYAIRTGTHPAITTQENINTYRRQLQSLGFSYDWEREFATSDPQYYKWTQWLFVKLFERGLAYEAHVNVNFCPALGTVLANEEVENGKSKEGGYPVERRPLKQWILRITAYADRLLADLDLLDWPEHLKKLQANWIGRSEGALIFFQAETTEVELPVFTTRPDTLFGVTYLVISPEHPSLKKLVTPDRQAEVDAYREKAARKSDLERTDLAKEKSGVWTGSFALHPVTHEKIPVWVADYVLSGYGTGAVMAVPSHDERDFEFAKNYNLPLLCVYDPKTDSEHREVILRKEAPWTGEGTLIQSEGGGLSLNGLSLEEAKKTVIEWLEKEEKGKRSINYKLRDWLFSRQRYWGEPIPIIHLEDGSTRALELDELPLLPPPLEDYKPAQTGESALAKVREWVEITDPKSGKKATRETSTMPQWAGSCWYYLRFCDPQNREKSWDFSAESYWMPVDLYVGGVEHAVLHLLYARFWHKVLYDCGLVHTVEPFMTLRNQGLVVARSYKRPSGGYVSPEDVIEREGSFFTTDGEELLSQIEKMSKSKLNGVSPDEMIEEFGADSLRLYEMFMGPFDREKVWSTDAVSGCRRFLNRFFDLVHSEKVTEENTEAAWRLAHRVAEKVMRDIEEMQFNTAIASMMEFLNYFSQLPEYPRDALKMAIQVLYPFAPHIAEDLWEHLGETQLLIDVPLPVIDPKYLIDESAMYIVQINGKLRGRLELPKDRSEEELLALVRTRPEIVKYIQGEIAKTVYVPNKLLSIVLKQ